MKKMYLIAASVMLAATTWQASAQMTMTADFKPAPPISDEAVINTTYGCLPRGFASLPENTNFFGYPELWMFEWTIHAGGCFNTTGKTLLRFDEMCTIPPTAIIDYAELRLFGVSSSIACPQGNSWYPGTPYSDNPGWVKRITSPWSNTTVTYNTAPTNTIVNQTPIPVTTTQWNNNFAIDVTALTQDIMTSGVNYGYWLELQSTAYYRSTVWASSYCGIPASYPELFVKYHLPCNANFTACNTTDNPNTYNFTAADGTYPDVYTWDFGDGSPTVTGIAATHTYMAPGSYKVCLTLSDAGGKPLCEQCILVCVNDIVKPCVPEGKPSGKSSTGAHTTIKTPVLDGTLNIISVSPNPANSILNVNLELIAGGNVQYKVYDMTGKEVLQGKTTMGKGQQTMSIPVDKLISGNYMLEMQDNYSKTNAKFTKE